MAAETVDGVFSSRSCQTIIAFLAILKAGLAYLPLDVKTPAARLELILSAVPGPTLVLLGADMKTPDINLPKIKFIPLAEVEYQDCSSFSPRHSHQPSATSLAYVIFTSGSTGKPKGVMIEHRGIVRLVKNSVCFREFPDAANVAHLSNVAFDSSVWEIYSALLNGVTLVCIDYFTTLDSEALCTTMVSERVCMATFTPALRKQCLANAPDTLSLLDILYVVGDRLHPSDAIAARKLVRNHVYNAIASLLKHCWDLLGACSLRRTFAPYYQQTRPDVLLEIPKGYGAPLMQQWQCRRTWPEKRPSCMIEAVA
jgi:non-ribosomal peptide synthetase component F